MIGWSLREVKSPYCKGLRTAPLRASVSPSVIYEPFWPCYEKPFHIYRVGQGWWGRFSESHPANAPPLLRRFLSKETMTPPISQEGPRPDIRAGPPPSFHKELVRPFQ